MRAIEPHAIGVGGALAHAEVVDADRCIARTVSGREALEGDARVVLARLALFAARAKLVDSQRPAICFGRTAEVRIVLRARCANDEQTQYEFNMSPPVAPTPQRLPEF
jgi:hypothetical protein